MDAVFFMGKRAASKCPANFFNYIVTEFLLPPCEPFACLFALTKSLVAVDNRGQKETSQSVAFALNR